MVMRAYEQQHEHAYDKSMFDNYANTVAEKLDDNLTLSSRQRYGFALDEGINTDGHIVTYTKLQEYRIDDANDYILVDYYDSVFVIEALMAALKDAGKTDVEIVEIIDAKVNELKRMKQRIKETPTREKIHLTT